MARLAAAVRATSALQVVAALIGVAPPAKVGWVLSAAVAFLAWTICYTRLAWTRGLVPWVVAVDVAVAVGLGLAAGQLVAFPALVTGWGWVSGLASIVAICAQLAGSPLISIPAGLAVAGATATGLYWAHAPSVAVVTVGVTIATQTVVSAAVMAVASRTGRVAERAFTVLERAEQEAEIARVRREDELAQLRLLHNGPVTTLSMAISGVGVSSDVVRRRAAEDLMLLPALSATATQESTSFAFLDEHLAQVVVWFEPRLVVTVALPTCRVPRVVADAFADALAEALENVDRHAGVSSASVTLVEADGAVRVTVADAGKGFEAGTVSSHRFGIREAIVGRMRAVCGEATVRSDPAHGSTVTLEWRRD